MIKFKVYDEKRKKETNKQKKPKKYMKALGDIFLWTAPLTRDIIYAANLRETEIIY